MYFLRTEGDQKAFEEGRWHEGKKASRDAFRQGFHLQSRKSGMMRNTNIARLDSKGRLLIPSHIRKFLNVDDGTEVIILPDNEKSEARILPLVRDKTAEFRITMADSPGSLAVIAGILARYNINVLMSKSRSIVKGKVAEWDLIVDTSACSGKIDRMRTNLLGSNLIKNMEILRV